jgi:hypothetical protein
MYLCLYTVVHVRIFKGTCVYVCTIVHIRRVCTVVHVDVESALHTCSAARARNPRRRHYVLSDPFQTIC